MDALTDVLVSEFADFSADGLIRLIVRLIVAGFCGGLIGWERGRAGKAAGVRTHILVAVGAAVFVSIPQFLAGGPDPISRVLQGVATGIGFLGAGCIIKDTHDNQVRGLTTAAGIWLTAAAGAIAGSGRGASAVLVGAFGWFVLSILGRIERWVDSGRSASTD
jgi:putative Mg2+ transporter-C (MgtC) family protein